MRCVIPILLTNIAGRHEQKHLSEIREHLENRNMSALDPNKKEKLQHTDNENITRSFAKLS